jgi:hypothetical protein
LKFKEIAKIGFTLGPNGIGHTLDPMENRWSPISIQKWILIKGLVSGFREPL